MLNFRAGQYAEAVDMMTQLVDAADKKGGKDKAGPLRSRVQHNLALAQLLAGKTKAAEFEALLAKLLAEIQTSQMQQSESESSLGGLKMRKGKEWNDEQDFDKSRSVVFSGVNLPYPSLSTERDATLLRYNLAASFFRQKKYASASSILDALLRAVEPIDENVAMHICFLYIDVILHSSRSSSIAESTLLSLRQKAHDILSYLESPHVFNGLAENKEPAKDAGAREREIIEFKFRIHLYKAKIALMQENVKIAKKEVKTAMEVFQKEIKVKETTTVPSAIGVSVGSIYVPSTIIQNSAALYLKAQLEYLRRNFKKSIKLVASCKKSSVDDSIMLNNLGCIHAQLGHHQAAQSYFAKALEATKARQASSSLLGSSVQSEILYNNGLQLLVQKKYNVAFRCFAGASRLFFNRPKLWLRMGECVTASIASTRQSVPLEYKNSLVQAVVGHGAHRRVMLPTSTPEVSEIEEGMNLPYAIKCFRNAVLLSTQYIEAKASEVSTLEGMDDVAYYGMMLSEEKQVQWSTRVLDAIRQKALVNLAYAYLCLKEPNLALATCRELLALPTCMNANKYLGRTYAAEALSLLSRSSEATILLKTTEMVALADEYAKEAHLDTASVQADVHVNNATAFLLQKNMQMAEQNVALAVRTCQTSRAALEQLVYVLLRKGTMATEVALEELARQRGFELINESVYVPPQVKPSAVESDRCFCSPDDGKACFDETCINVATYTECPRDRCPAGESCHNQRLQRPEKFPNLEPFLTQHKGYGVRTLERIGANGPVGEYVGEIINQKELQQRCSQLGRMETNFYYIQVEPGIYNDARHKGGFTRFVNHSCNPNCKVEKWIVNGEMRFLVYALRNIEPMEELTFDYQWQVLGTMRIVCHCAEPSCKGYIGEEVPLPEAQGVYKEPTKHDTKFNLVGKKIRIFQSNRDDAPFTHARIIDYNPETNEHDIQEFDALNEPGEERSVVLEGVKYQVYLDFEGLSEADIQKHIFSIPKVQRPQPRKRTRWDVQTPVNIEAPAASPPPASMFVAKASPPAARKLLVKNLDAVCNEEYFRKMLGSRASTLVSFDMFLFNEPKNGVKYGWALLEFSDSKVFEAMAARLNKRILVDLLVNSCEASEREVNHYEKTKLYRAYRPSSSPFMTPSPPPEEIQTIPYCFGRNLNWIVKDPLETPSRRIGMSAAVETTLREKCTKIIVYVAKKHHVEREDYVAAVLLLYRYISRNAMNASTIEWVAATCLYLVLKCHSRSINWEAFALAIYEAKYPSSSSENAVKIVQRQLLANELLVLEGCRYDVSSQNPYRLLDFYLKRQSLVSYDTQQEAKYLLVASLHHTIWMQCSPEAIVLAILYVIMAHDILVRPDRKRLNRYPADILPAVLPKYFDTWQLSTRLITKIFCLNVEDTNHSERLLALLDSWTHKPEFSSEDKDRKFPPLDQFADLPAVSSAMDDRCTTADLEDILRIRKRCFLAKMSSKNPYDLAGREVYVQPWPYRDHNSFISETSGISESSLQELAAVMKLQVVEPTLIVQMLGVLFPDPKSKGRKPAPLTQFPEDNIILGLTTQEQIDSTNNTLQPDTHCLIFERPLHLYSSLLNAKVKISYSIRKRVVLDLFRSVALCHDHDIVHRSISPYNLFVFKHGVKLGGFYNARRVATKGDFPGGYIMKIEDYCEHTYGTLLQTSAPEILLGAKVYTKQSDMWSAGIVAISILLGCPFIYGKDWKTQMEYIFRTCGTPNGEAEGTKLEKYAQCAPKRNYAPRIRKAILERSPTFPEDCEIFESLLSLDPEQRPSARKLLKSDLFKDVDHNIDFDVFEPTLKTEFKRKLSIDMNSPLKKKKHQR
ncbi:CCR4-NOT transcription complex subunit [Thraustotheca clavata]|uniref:CCR4-NOT transcription complex subunit n=1 Tax=Thraustotheca clavata TaxID=74557 RepID=A0A1W0A418_9STRA|nr:CCR4-NOT transcription complex subunit [Thraustotheca clavata]